MCGLVLSQTIYALDGNLYDPSCIRPGPFYFYLSSILLSVETYYLPLFPSFSVFPSLFLYLSLYPRVITATVVFVDQTIA